MIRLVPSNVFQHGISDGNSNVVCLSSLNYYLLAIDDWQSTHTLTSLATSSLERVTRPVYVRGCELQSTMWVVAVKQDLPSLANFNI